MLTFYNAPDAKQAARALQDRLLQELSAQKRVLWLVPGGSNIPLTVEIMKHIPTDAQGHLAIMLTDERFGDFNHEDSNLFQLAVAGFDAGKTSVVPVLTPDNLTLTQTCQRYAQAIKAAFSNADLVIGQFGMGADGHIAGILPGSPAVDSEELVCGYDAGDLIRITLTPLALKHITAGYAYIYGEAKREALLNLQAKTLPLTEQPAQILKQLPEAYVYNDQMGEPA